MLSAVFSKLDEWRHLPSYQLERRVDVFFGLFLPEVLAALSDRKPVLGTLIPDDVHVVPEFPLHKGLLGISKNKQQGHDNQSVKVDFAVFSPNSERKRIFLVELKTEPKSVSKPQLKNMVKAKCAGSEKLLDGVIKAANASAEPRKYAQLIWRLGQLGCVKIPPRFRQMRMEVKRPGLAANLKLVCVGESWSDAEVELVLMFPKRKDTQHMEVDKKLEELYSKFHCVEFPEIAAIIKKSQRPFASDFAKYLCKWAKQDAGKANPWVDS